MPNTLYSALALAGSVTAAGQLLAPANDINLLASETATNPLTWLGANSPWFAGDNVYDISSSVPDGCYVDMASYNVRHGSRYPDNGAYNGWVDMYERFQNASATGTGPLFFLSTWSPVLTDPTTQIAQLSPTGWKEAFDLGYKLRTLYPTFYNQSAEQTQYVWANKYSRVTQTAQLFLHGYLGTNATRFGRVVSVDRDAAPLAIGNSLSPSDTCPNFEDDSGEEEQATWGEQWIPAVKARLMALLTEPTAEDFEFTDNDVTQVPYLCGFESQILGKLSPWCDVFTDEELKDYEYWNDFRYFYGVGAGTELPRKMMTPYLKDLVDILAEGPGQTGSAREGNGTFEFPRLVMAFMNDGQINELAVASGVYDEQGLLNETVRDDERLYMARRLSTLRGTIAFERLVCEGNGSGGGNGSGSGSGDGSDGTDVGHGDGHGSGTGTVGSGYPSHTGTGAYEDGDGYNDDETWEDAHYASTHKRIARSSNTTATSKTYVRILINDAVYVVPSCQSGPGRSCPMDQYVQYMADKVADEGDWMVNCNVTDPDAPAEAGASFFKDLTGDYIEILEP